MKFRIVASDLAKILSYVSVSQSNSKFSGFLFQINENACSVFGNSVDFFSLAKFAPESIASFGTFAVNAATIINVVNQFQSETITLELQEQSQDAKSLLITSNNSSFSIALEQEFDNLIKENEQPLNSLVINSKALKQSLENVSFCASTASDRQTMNSVYIHNNNNNLLSFVSTDGRKLGISISENAASNFPKTGFILPKKFIDHLISILSNFDTDIQIHFSNEEMKIQCMNVLMSCRFVSGNFPDYQAIIPTNYPNILDIKKAEIVKSLKKINSIDKSSDICVRLDVSSNSVTFVANSHLNKVTTSCEASCSTSSFSISFNSKDLLDIISHIGANDSTIRISLGESNATPVLISKLTDLSNKYILAPMII